LTIAKKKLPPIKEKITAKQHNEITVQEISLKYLVVKRSILLSIFISLMNYTATTIKVK
jgi:hypothetical protein